MLNANVLDQTGSGTFALKNLMVIQSLKAK